MEIEEIGVAGSVIKRAVMQGASSHAGIDDHYFSDEAGRRSRADRMRSLSFDLRPGGATLSRPFRGLVLRDRKRVLLTACGDKNTGTLTETAPKAKMGRSVLEAIPHLRGPQGKPYSSQATMITGLEVWILLVYREKTGNTYYEVSRPVVAEGDRILAYDRRLLFPKLMVSEVLVKDSSKKSEETSDGKSKTATPADDFQVRFK